MIKNVANNVAQGNSQHLTEQWKNGELEEGFYYIYDGAEVTIDYYLCDYWERHFDSYVQQVLAEVPDYIEWKNYVNGYCEEHNYNLKLQEENAKLKETIKRTKANGNYPSRISAYKSRIATLCEENQKLKDLLKECREFVGLAGYLSLDNADDNTTEQCNKLLTKINEVLK